MSDFERPQGEVRRISLPRTLVNSVSFGGIMTKRTTEEIVDFGESEGVRVEREAKFEIVRP